MAPATRRRGQNEDGDDTADKKNRAKPLLWDQNRNWTHRAITYLIQTPTFRLKLFSDSSSDAKEEDRRKVQAKEAKTILYAELAKVIFQHEDVAPDVREDYAKNPTRFAKSTQQQFIRLKKTYQEYRNQFKVTGGGVMPDDKAENLSEKINEEWVFYEDLHSMWSELPNYNTVGVSNSSPGQDFGSKAAALFGGQVSSPEASSGIDDFDLTTDPGKSEPDDDFSVEPDSDIEIKISRKPKGAKEEKEKVATLTSDKDKRGKRPGDDKSKKRSATENLDDIHILELKDAAARRAEKNAIRLKELDIAQKKQEFEREKFQAKLRKMEFEQRRQEANTQMMMFRMNQGGGLGGPSQMASYPYQHGFDTNLSQSQAGGITGEFTAQLYSNNLDNLCLPPSEGPSGEQHIE